MVVMRAIGRPVLRSCLESSQLASQTVAVRSASAASSWFAPPNSCQSVSHEPLVMRMYAGRPARAGCVAAAPDFAEGRTDAAADVESGSRSPARSPTISSIMYRPSRTAVSVEVSRKLTNTSAMNGPPKSVGMPNSTG